MERTDLGDDGLPVLRLHPSDGVTGPADDMPQELPGGQ